MIKHNQFVKLLKKINLEINRLLIDNLNKLNYIQISKITKSNKFLLSFVASFFIVLSYLSIPNIYDKAEISKKLDYQLQKKLNIKFNLSENISYNFLPRPHFIYKNSSIIKNQSKISKIEKLKIFISLSNLFTLKNFEVQNVILEKSNFNLDYLTHDFFIKLLDNDFRHSKLIIKDSKVFYKNKDNEILFMNKILDMKYSYDDKNFTNKVVSKNEIFNLPYLIELNKNKVEQKIFSKLNLDFLKLKANNELDFSKKTKKGFINFTLDKNKFSATYNISENNFIFNLFDNLEKSKFNYRGELNFNPFFSNIYGTMEEINILYLLNSKNLFPQFLKTEILNNKKLNIDTNIFADEVENINDFNKIFLNLKINEGLIDIDNSKISWKKNVDFLFTDTLIYVEDGELILEGNFNLSIKDYNKIYKFLLTPKKNRNELKNIKANFVYNFDQKIININDIAIDNNINKNVNKTLEKLKFGKNKLQNRIYLKKMINKALTFYDG